ncbi:pirin-related protein [Vibrio ishigakensis]|uniref:Pirin-related protein n=1 Tax=Vibrio ishigakensis TaxID=1481914 RepID=A0A0B8QH60_9VIBR|nr:pirin-related protein [Vibrio ishigakensis]
MNRQNIQKLKAQPTSDGDGVKIARIAGFDHPDFSPFLMIDELKSDDRKDYVGGFPPHPHRGIETLTYMLRGHFQHKDHMGNVGELRTGGAQWMAAGRGVIHSEMPIMENGQLHGFQIWINQPAKHKMSPARYKDFQPETITEVPIGKHGLVRVIAGEIALDGTSIQGPLLESSADISVADISSSQPLNVKVSLKPNYQVLIYVYKGNLELAGTQFKAGEMALCRATDLETLRLDHETGLLLLSGAPINESIVHYGPFVMNSEQEIMQTIQDYNSGVFETY